MPYAAVLDANVLHPIMTTQVLLRLADRGLFRPIWSREILDEVQSSLERRGIDSAKIERRLRVMKAHYTEAMADDVDRFLSAVPDAVEADDRHVVAAALASKADAIVTNNVDDIPAGALSELSIEVQSLDSFLLNQLTLDADAVYDVFAEIEEDLARPPMTINDVVEALGQHAPHFTVAMREVIASR